MKSWSDQPQFLHLLEPPQTSYLLPAWCLQKTPNKQKKTWYMWQIYYNTIREKSQSGFLNITAKGQDQTAVFLCGFIHTCTHIYLSIYIERYINTHIYDKNSSLAVYIQLLLKLMWPCSEYTHIIVDHHLTTLIAMFHQFSVL